MKPNPCEDGGACVHLQIGGHTVKLAKYHVGAPDGTFEVRRKLWRRLLEEFRRAEECSHK